MTKLRQQEVASVKLIDSSGRLLAPLVTSSCKKRVCVCGFTGPVLTPMHVLFLGQQVPSVVKAIGVTVSSIATDTRKPYCACCQKKLKDASRFKL